MVQIVHTPVIIASYSSCGNYWNERL